MIKRFLPILFLLAASCIEDGAPVVTAHPDAYDLRGEVALYLDTADSKTEDAVVARMKDHGITGDALRAVLRAEAPKTDEPRGLRDNLPLTLGDHQYSYSLFVPEGPAPEGGFPLMVILHGMGGSGDTTIGKWIPRLQNRYIIACPSYPMGAWWSANAESLTLELIRDLLSRLPADRNRVFLSGLSNGAIGAFWIGMNHPHRFAGIVPVAGGITERLMHFLVNLKNTPIYIIHGRRDPVFPIAYLRRIDRILSDMKYPAVYREHDESGSAHGGHFLPEGEVAPLLEWLDRQKRDTLPEIIRMTREGNHLGPIHWARVRQGIDLAALQMPGPEKETLNIRDGKIATLFATRRSRNRFEVTSKNVREYELLLNPDMVDFSQPVRVTTQELLDVKNQLIPGETKLSFNGMVSPDIATLLSGFKRDRDPGLLYDAVLVISTENNFEIARRP